MFSQKRQNTQHTARTRTRIPHTHTHLWPSSSYLAQIISDSMQNADTQDNLCLL